MEISHDTFLKPTVLLIGTEWYEILYTLTGVWDKKSLEKELLSLLVYL